MLTPREYEILSRIVKSDYHDGENVVNHPTWLFDIEVNTKSDGAVLTNLQRAGFVVVDVDDFDHMDSTVQITELGYAEWQNAS